jgi:hypothetical protein
MSALASRRMPMTPAEACIRASSVAHRHSDRQSNERRVPVDETG